jgi:hypothetical protein
VLLPTATLLCGDPWSGRRRLGELAPSPCGTKPAWDQEGRYVVGAVDNGGGRRRHSGNRRHRRRWSSAGRGEGSLSRDDNSDPMGIGYGDNFLSIGIHDPNRDGYETSIFFLPTGNPTGTRYFTTAIILGCE